MKDIQDIKKYLLTVHPVRRTSGQKAECRQWILRELKRAGWRPWEETYGKFNGSVNIVAGDPDRANVFLCTHYDTASRMLLPDFVSPTNVAAHVLYHALVALILIVLALAASFTVSFPLNQPGLMLPLFLILLVGLLFFAAFGPANLSNANGNTSGVLALLAIAKIVRRDDRVCIVFFDNNARNLLGAGAFKKAHPNAAQSCLFLNFDCVGDGDSIQFFPRRRLKKDGDAMARMEAAFLPSRGKDVQMVRGFGFYPSDNANFKKGAGVCALKRKPVVGYYMDRIHTSKDTSLDEANIALLRDGALRYIAALG